MLLPIKIKIYKLYQYIQWILNKRKYPDEDVIRIHLGCGEIDYPGFINVDLVLKNHIHHLSSVEKLSFFRNDYADLIYTSHCLEHISHQRIGEVLQEWYRVLKPGGTLRISVPDFDTILKIYNENGKDMKSIILPLMGNQDYKYNFHYTNFNYTYLKELLINTGFENVSKWNFGESLYKSLPDWSGEKINVNGRDYFISLNVEAVK